MRGLFSLPEASRRVARTPRRPAAGARQNTAPPDLGNCEEGIQANGINNKHDDVQLGADVQNKHMHLFFFTVCVTDFSLIEAWSCCECRCVFTHVVFEPICSMNEPDVALLF